jgi:hypothetical protein
MKWPNEDEKNNLGTPLNRWTRMVKAHIVLLAYLFRGWIDGMHGCLLSREGFQLHLNIQPLHYQKVKSQF